MIAQAHAVTAVYFCVLPHLGAIVASPVRPAGVIVAGSIIIAGGTGACAVAEGAVHAGWVASRGHAVGALPAGGACASVAGVILIWSQVVASSSMLARFVAQLSALIKVLRAEGRQV